MFLHQVAVNIPILKLLPSGLDGAGLHLGKLVKLDVFIIFPADSASKVLYIGIDQSQTASF
jgi:hypothetical protein